MAEAVPGCPAGEPQPLETTVQEELQNNDEHQESTGQPTVVPVEEKLNDSDDNFEDTNKQDEQVDVNVNSNSQFYESSDSKIDYAVKIDDNDTLSDIEDIKTDSASADSEDSALGSLPPDAAINEREEAQDRSDGSDSGLGSETTEDAKVPNFGINVRAEEIPRPESSEEETKPDVGISNNALADDDNNKPTSSIATPMRSSLKRKRENETSNEPEAKKRKEGIKFDNITVYYFPRAQGFTCVPSQGGSTLGMEWKHTHVDKFTLAEHAIEQRRLHRQLLQQLKSERHSLQGATFSSSEESDTEEEASDISDSELDLDSYYFLQPVPTRQRRALLRAAGLRKIEAYEKDECRDIRTSREFCGCACKGGCNPQTCSCSLAGIKCQVDRLHFPCGCTRDGCCNTTGRIEFNPVRVRTHFIHTLMRISMEKKNEEEALKRHWAETARAANVSCLANSTYSRENVQDDGLVRDVNLTPRVEVESCVNAGSFSNIHCNANNSHTGHASSIQGNINYHRSINPSESGVMHTNDAINHNQQVNPYTCNILQGKGPPYTISNSVDFNSLGHTPQRFQCTYNYGQADNNHFKNLQSFSASTFEEFAHNSHMAMFSHYGHMYSPDYIHKQNPNTHEHNALQYHSMTQNHYEVYKNTLAASGEHKGDTSYTTLMTLPYHSTNKLQTIENDENWFSQATLMSLDHGEQTQDAADAPPPAPAPAPLAAATLAPAADAADAAAPDTDNLGELIKNTMVESVSV